MYNPQAEELRNLQGHVGLEPCLASLEAGVGQDHAVQSLKSMTIEYLSYAMTPLGTLSF